MFDTEQKSEHTEQLSSLKVNANPTKDFIGFLTDLLKTGVVVFALAFLLRYFAIQPYIVDGESMMPNYINNEYLLAEKITYLFGQPQRGDVVVFKYPKNPSVNYIKRIIGLPGEDIKIENNKITIANSSNPEGFVLSENYIPKDDITNAINGNTLEKHLNENEFFVLGDNREHSSDSREWGVLPKANISGRAWLTLVPLKEFGIHKHATY
ncbi:MAG: signal peptidase I [Patescibacteria group bacterium]